jgi:Tfp pilus assembly protein PilF
MALIATAGPVRIAASQTGVPTAVQAKRFALRVRMASDSPEPTALTLWYTRDRGETWHRGPKARAGSDSVVFEAPGEGLYGFYVVAGDPRGTSSPDPKTGTTPQRWVYVDYTPPLAQWKNVEVLADRSGARPVVMTWAAHDANFDSRPIALAYQPAGQAYWTTIDGALPNTGRYDWTPPDDLTGRVTFKLLVRDLGSHVVERLFGPISLDAPAVVAAPQSTSQPTTRRIVQASPLATRPVEPMGPIDPARRDRAQKLYDQGTWHRVRGQYAEAQERFTEALEIDPMLLAARTDLAGVFCTRGRYGEAIKEYLDVLKADPARPTALRGLALAYVARREYASAREMLERLLLHDAKNAEAWLDLGDVAYQTGDRATARLHWSKAATVDPAAGDVILKAQNRLSLFLPAAAEPKRTEAQ